MAAYKVWLTVKDEYGNLKEVDSGIIDVDLEAFSKDELSIIEEALPLEDYIKRENLTIELDSFATDNEVAQALQKIESIRYSDFVMKEEVSSGE